MTIAQVSRKVMLADVVQRHGVDHRGLIARLKRHPELFDGLTNHRRVAATVGGRRLPVETITLDLAGRGAYLCAQERLPTNDALTRDVMEKLVVNRPRNQPSQPTSKELSRSVHSRSGLAWPKANGNGAEKAGRSNWHAAECLLLNEGL